MKISVKALFKTSGITCVFRDQDAESGQITEFPARIAFVTEQTVAATRDLARTSEEFRISDGDPDVGYGSIVTAGRTAEGGFGRVLNPGEQAAFFVDVGGEKLNLTGTGMLGLREKMIAFSRKGGTLDADQRRALSGVQEIFEMVCSAPDVDRFTPELIAQSYLAAMIDAFGQTDMPFEAEAFARKSRSDLLKARIGLLDPGHPDALGSAQDLRTLLSSCGVRVNASGVGEDIRTPSVRNITEEAMRRTIMGNARMRDDLIGSVTMSPVTELSAALIHSDNYVALKSEKASRRLSGQWVDHLRSVAREATQNTDDPSSFDMDVFSEKGRDILVISDQVAKQQDVAFVYSWKTTDRVAVMDTDMGRVISASEEEVPDDAEIDRLKSVLVSLEAQKPYSGDADMLEKEKVRFDH